MQMQELLPRGWRSAALAAFLCWLGGADGPAVAQPVGTFSTMSYGDFVTKVAHSIPAQNWAGAQLDQAYASGVTLAAIKQTAYAALPSTGGTLSGPLTVPSLLLPSDSAGTRPTFSSTPSVLGLSLNTLLNTTGLNSSGGIYAPGVVLGASTSNLELGTTAASSAPALIWNGQGVHASVVETNDQPGTLDYYAGSKLLLSLGTGTTGATFGVPLSLSTSPAATDRSFAAATTYMVGGAVDTETSRAKTAESTTAQGLSPFVATGGVASRTPADRAADVLNEVDYLLPTDTDDTAAVQKLYSVAQNRMALGQDPILFFPHKITVSTMPQLQMPVGRSPMFMSAPRGGTEIVVNGASNGIDIQATYTGSQVLSSPGIGDFRITKGASAPIGYDAVRIAGLPNSVSPGAVYGAHVGSENCRGSGFGGATPNPWAACVEFVDQNYSWLESVTYAYDGPANGEQKSGVGVLYTTTQSSTAGNFSVDHFIGNVTMNSGFAGVLTQGHVEGVRVGSGAIVGAVYGVRCPAWAMPGGGYGGCDGIYVTQTHMNVVLRGIYAEYSANVQTDSSDYFVSPNNGAASALATDAVLPLTTTALNPSNNLNGYSWVGVDCVSCNYTSIIGTSFYGTGAGYSNAVRLTVLPYNGTAAPSSVGYGNKVSAIQAFAINGYAVHTDPAIQDSQVDDNNTIAVSGYELGAGTEHHGNFNSGVPYDTGFLNGQYLVQGDVAPSGRILDPYGYEVIGGTNRGVLDFRNAGYTGTAQNARIELAPGVGTATGTNDGQLNFSAAGFNFNANLTAAGFTSTALSNFQAEVDMTYGLFRLGGTNRGVLDFRGAGYTGSGGNVRIELSPATQGSPTGQADGQLNISDLLTNFNSPIQALGVITDQSGLGVAAGSATAIFAGNTMRRVMLQGAVGTTLSNTVSVTLPPNPIDQQQFDIVGDINITNFSVIAPANTAGQTPVIALAPTSFAYNNPVSFIYVAANRVWEPSIGVGSGTVVAGGSGSGSSINPVTTAGGVGPSYTLTFAASGNNTYDLTPGQTLSLSLGGGTSGQYQTLTLVIRQPAATGYQVTLPSNVKWTGGSPPAVPTAAGSFFIATLATDDGGATYFGRQ